MSAPQQEVDIRHLIADLVIRARALELQNAALTTRLDEAQKQVLSLIEKKAQAEGAK